MADGPRAAPWAGAAIPGLDPVDAALLDALPVSQVPVGARLFGPGDRAQGFVVVLDGKVDVGLVGPSGREILLYSVEPGQSCVQTTLSLMADEPYSGEALCARPARVVVIPAGLFRQLMDRSGAFRGFVFAALGNRLSDLTHLLERVAFVRLEARLAEVLLDMADPSGDVHATHAEIAARIGSAREVVSRRLDTMAREGHVTLARGVVRIVDRRALGALARVV